MKDFLKFSFYNLRIIKGNIQNFLFNQLDFFYSNIIIRTPFLSSYKKVRLISLASLKKLNDKNIKKIGLAKDKGYLALKIISNIDPHDQIMILKIVYLISFNRYKHFNLTKLINYLKENNYTVQELKYFINCLPGSFAEYGDYDRHEKLLLWIKKEIDNKLNRKIGIYNESAYFTAIGHLTLLVNFLKAIDLNIINKEVTNLNIVKTNMPPINLEYSNLLIEKCEEFGLKINYVNCSYIDLEPDIELWPTNAASQYSFGRHLYGLVEGCWELKKGKEFLQPKKEHLEIAKRIFIDNFGKVPEVFVGLHLRTTNDSRTLRNFDTSNASYAINNVLERGFDCILVGKKARSNIKIFSNKIYDLDESINIFDTTGLKLSTYQRECLQIFVWSKSRFFIGSLSGGTFPPTTFGTPTIWLDIHPQIHIRMASRHDHVLPKRIFFEKENRFLEFKELFEDRHISSQSENAEYVKEKGYKVLGCDKNQIKKSIENMILETGVERKLNFNKSEKELYSRALQKMLKKGKYKKFEFGGKYY